MPVMAAIDGRPIIVLNAAADWHFTTLLAIASSSSFTFGPILLTIVGIAINYIGLAAEFEKSSWC